jgi:hypothetical protein
VVPRRGRGRDCAPAVLDRSPVNSTVTGHMNTPVDSLAPAVPMPRRVRVALFLLWAVWLLSLGTLVMQLLAYRGSATDLRSIIGFPAAVVQAVLIYLIGKRRNIARIVLSVLILLAVPALMFQSLVLTQSLFSPLVFGSLRYDIGLAVKVTAAVLLLTPAAARWFKRAESSPRGL